MKIAIGCDHGGFTMKQELLGYISELGYKYKDFGCFSTESMDYPDVAFPAAEAVAGGAFERGLLICTTGIGMSICANKVRGIRCALCSDVRSAEMTRRHNNTNILALGANVVSIETAKEILNVWLKTEFEGGRHERRVNKIMDYERAH